MSHSEELHDSIVEIFKSYDNDDKSDDDCLLEMIENIVSNYQAHVIQETILYSNDDIIHQACVYQIPAKAFKYLLDHDIERQTIFRNDKYDRFPTNNTCENNASMEVEVTQNLLEHGTTKTSHIIELYDSVIKVFRGYHTNSEEDNEGNNDDDKGEDCLLKKVESVFSNCSADAVQETILYSNDEGQLLIHQACFYQIPAIVFKYLLDQDIERQTIFQKDKYDRFPINNACENNASMEVIQLLLAQGTTKISHITELYESVVEKFKQFGTRIDEESENNDNVVLLETVKNEFNKYSADDIRETMFYPNDEGQLLIHQACNCQIPANAIKYLLDQDIEKETIFQRDENNDLPIHVACYNDASVEVIRLLLAYDSEKQTILEKGSDDRLPIQIICTKSASEDVIRLLLTHDIKNKTIFQKDNIDRLPIHWGCKKNLSMEILKLLLKPDVENKTVFQEDQDGYLPIYYACYNDNDSVEMIKFLLHHETNKRMEELIHIPFYKREISDRIDQLNGETGRQKEEQVEEIRKFVEHCKLVKRATFPIHYVCKTSASTEMIRLLLEHDVENQAIFEKDEFGRLPIHWACCNKNASEELIRLLLECDIEIETILEKDAGGSLPLHQACKTNTSAEAIQSLLELDVKNQTLLQTDDCDCLPIHLACISNVSAGVIRLLLECDIEKETIFQKDAVGSLPLHHACKNNISVKAIQSLLELDVKNQTILQRDDCGCLPLHLACINNASADVIRLLLKQDTKNTTIFEKDNNDRLPIHWACGKNKSVEVMRLLLELDTENKTIFQKDRWNLPIHWACANNASADVIKLLLKYDTQNKTIFQKDNFDRLPIHWACKKSASVEVIQLLLKHDIENKTILEEDKHGCLPIHFSCSKQVDVSTEEIQLLLKHDVKNRTIFQKNTAGNLPSDCAGQNGNASVEIIKLLFRHETKELTRIPFYKIKISNSIDKISGETESEKREQVEEIRKFVEHCKSVERATLLELSLIKSGLSHGVHVIKERVLEFI